MDIKAALVDKVVTLKPEQTVEEAVALFKKKNIRSAPVVDGKQLVGYFSLRHLMKGLLPVSVDTDLGMRVPLGAAPGLEKRLRKLKPQPVSMLMERDMPVAKPDMPLWEIIGLLTQTGRPLPVTDAEGAFVGLVSELTALEALEAEG
ncbi:MAG: CBS domain-containing protein [Rhodospirillales bacterium]|nr:CBS domain-containing protein [Rhodospirillales bacterium]